MNTNPNEMIITVAQAKAEPGGGILGHAKDDEITQAIAGISQYWLQRCGVFSLSTTFDVTETYDGTGTQRLKLRQPPCNSVSVLNIAGCLVPAITVPVTGAGYGIEDNGNFLFVRGYQFWRGTQNVQVAYNSGNDGAPADIVSAVARHVMLWYKRKDEINLKSLSAMGGTTTYLNDIELTPDIERVIRLHSRLGM